VVEEYRVPGFKAGEVIEISSDEEEESESEAEEQEEYEAEQDNRVEAEAEAEGERGEEQDKKIEAESAVEDEFEGFDVNPVEKEFFNDLLHIAPPEAVMELTGKTRRTSPQALSKVAPDSQQTKRARIFAEVESLSDIAPDVQRTKRVKLFAEDHPFREKKKWVDDELQEYKDDIHEFAKAAGFSDLQADVEVGKAVGAWKIERGITLPSQLLMEATTDETKSDRGESVQEFKRRRKAEKKARRRLSRIEKQSSCSASLSVSETKAQSSQNLLTLDGPKLQTSQTYYVKQPTAASTSKNSTRDNVSLSATVEKSVGLALKEKRRNKAEKKRLRKKAKLGPKKSGYFPTTPRADLAPSPKSTDVEAPNIQPSRQEEERQLKEAKKLLAKVADEGHGAHLDRVKQMAQEAKQAVEKVLLLVKEVSAKEQDQKGLSKTTAEPEPVEKKKKNRNHKRHRNKNRLVDEQSVNNVTTASVVVADEALDMPSKKRSHDGYQKSSLAEDTVKVHMPDLASTKTSAVKHEDNSQKSFSQSAPDAGGGTGRPNKRRDRGRGRKPKTKNGDSEMRDAGEPAIAEAPIPASDYLLESIETIEPSSQKKRKRSKAKAGEGIIDSADVGEAAAVEPLTELPDTNVKLGGRIRCSEKRATSADAMEVGVRPSNQSSKVHHSQ
jgi:hypothetical protein